MNVREAVVIRLEGADAVVKVGREGGCGRCNEVGGCGSGLMSQIFGKACETYRAPNPAQAQPGDVVQVRLPEGGPFAAALLVYVLPLLGLLLGGGVGQGLGGSDGAIALGGAIGLVGGFLIGVTLSRRAAMRRLMAIALTMSAPADGEREA